MRYRDYSPIPEKEGQLALPDRLRGILKFGVNWPKEMESQHAVANSLKRNLDNRFSLLRNLELPEVNIRIPFLLIGPHGVLLLNPTPAQGVFQAKEHSWLISTPRGYEPGIPNWMQRTQLLAKAATLYLQRNNLLQAEVEGVLIFTNPGTHVDTSRPAVRILLSDALPRFAAGLAQEATRLSNEEAYQLVHALTQSAEAQPEPEPDQEQKPRPKSEPKAPAGPSQFEKSLEPIQKIFNFDRKQWLILAGLFAATVIVLMVFLLLLVFLI